MKLRNLTETGIGKATRILGHLFVLLFLIASVTAQDEEGIYTIEPGGEQFPYYIKNYNLPISVTPAGRVTWQHVPDAIADSRFWYNYTLKWSESGGRTGEKYLTFYFERTPSTSIPDFNPGLDYTISISYNIADLSHEDFPEVFIGWGSYGTALWNGATGTVSSGMADGRISPHAGTTLLVWIEDGEIVARDYTLDVELTAPADCSDGEQILAESDELKIECTAVDEFRVTQLVPQHPADGRRDILIFDAALTTCYRAYEYLESGALEVFWREC